MALCPKEKGKVVAEQPESLQESQALVTPTQTAVPSRGHCTCKQPALGLQRPPAHVAQMRAHTAWLQQLKEKMRVSFPLWR